MHDRAVEFNLTGFEKFINMLSDSTLLLTFKKLSLVEFGCRIKENPKLSENVIKIFLSFPVA